MEKENHSISVAVVTSTIGRQDLKRAIECVQSQTYPCKHYVFVDGEKYHSQAKEILDQYPNVIATYLPMNTGANGWTNSGINAIAPFLVKEDVICYLDDDNWYEPNHVEKCIKTFKETDAPYVYSLRNLYLANGEFICQDITESIGFYRNVVKYPVYVDLDESKEVGYSRNKTFHIDTNCFAMKKSVAQKVAPSWCLSKNNDTTVFKQLCSLGFEGKCTMEFSVNYILDPLKQSIYPDSIKELPVERITEIFCSILKKENELQKVAYDQHGGKNKFWEKS